jgi:hypothetical protein
MKSHKFWRFELVLDKIEVGCYCACTSILVAPRRKPSLIETIGSSMASHGELTGERNEGEEKGVRASYRGGGARRDAKERREGRHGICINKSSSACATMCA